MCGGETRRAARFFQRFPCSLAAVRFPTRTHFQSFPIVTDYGTIVAE
jgi:hypothetical protein